MAPAMSWPRYGSVAAAAAMAAGEAASGEPSNVQNSASAAYRARQAGHTLGKDASSDVRPTRVW